MSEVLGNGRWMRQQGHALAFQRLAQIRVGEQPIDAEFHAPLADGSSIAKQSG